MYKYMGYGHPIKLGILIDWSLYVYSTMQAYMYIYIYMLLKGGTLGPGIYIYILICVNYNMLRKSHNRSMDSGWMSIIHQPENSWKLAASYGDDSPMHSPSFQWRHDVMSPHNSSKWISPTFILMSEILNHPKFNHPYISWDGLVFLYWHGN